MTGVGVRRVVVVGAGIVGASVAHHLGRAGAEVTLVDASLPASGVTGASFGWIGGPAGGDVPDASTALRGTALADWRGLEAEVDGVHVQWTGSVVWGADRVPAARDLVPGERLLDADRVTALEPALRRPPALAVHRTRDGWVDPVVVTDALVDALRTRGGSVLAGVAATALVLDGGRVTGVDTTQGRLDADTVVLAAGAATPVLCAPLGMRIAVAPSFAVLVRLTAPSGLVRSLVDTGELELRADGDGFVMSAAGHDGGLGRADLQRTGEQVRQRVCATFAVDPAEVTVTRVLAGARPMPADGLPVVGPLPGVAGAYVTVLHSGVTLAPAVGRLVAGEVLHGRPAAELEGLRPGRAAVSGR